MCSGSLDGASVDIFSQYALSVAASRLLPSRMGCKSKERDVMGDAQASQVTGTRLQFLVLFGSACVSLFVEGRASLSRHLRGPRRRTRIWRCVVVCSCCSKRERRQRWSEKEKGDGSEGEGRGRGRGETERDGGRREREGGESGRDAGAEQSRAEAEQSRAEQSRAQQSRAEQSRAEQSRVE